MDQGIVDEWKEAFLKCHGESEHPVPEISFENQLYKFTATSILGRVEVKYYVESELVEMTKNLLSRCVTK